jgi:hypothetical protein
MSNMTTPARMTLQPSKAGKFTFETTRLIVTGKPTLSDFGAVFDWCGTIHGAIQWWVGDLLLAGEDLYNEELSQIIDALQIEHSTAEQWKWVCKNVPPENRHAPSSGLTFSHHREVADLPAPSQKKWLEMAAKGDDGAPWPVRKLGTEVRRAKKMGQLSYYVLVEAKSPEDADKMLATFQREGRKAKLVERDQKQLT